MVVLQLVVLHECGGHGHEEMLLQQQCLNMRIKRWTQNPTCNKHVSTAFIHTTEALALSTHAHVHACQQTLLEVPLFRGKLSLLWMTVFLLLTEMKWFNHGDWKVPYHHSLAYIKLIHLWIVLLEHLIFLNCYLWCWHFIFKNHSMSWA